MSIPGLGQIASQSVVASSRTITLQPFQEFRFQLAPTSTLKLKLLSGTAEKDGIELAPRNAYTFTGVRTKILSWHGCELEVDGICQQDEVRTLMNSGTTTTAAAAQYVKLHSRLDELRVSALRNGTEGPRVLVMGDRASGKTTLVRTLASYATKQGYQPMLVNADPSEGMLSLPGTLSASVFATVIDVEALDGWGSTPTSGPSLVPVKLPLVSYFGREIPQEDEGFYRNVVGKMAETTSGRLSEDEAVKRSGVIIDSFGVNSDDAVGMDLISHVVDEFSVNIVVVLGSPTIAEEADRRFAQAKTTLGETITVMSLDKSDGSVARSEQYLKDWQESVIKVYFFGDATRSLSPQIQQVSFDDITIFKIPEDLESGGPAGIARELPSYAMQYWIMAVMHASVKDSPETVRNASVMGFVYVSEVDEERRKMKILAPTSGRLGDRPLIWGRWPEPFISLLG